MRYKRVIPLVVKYVRGSPAGLGLHIYIHTFIYHTFIAPLKVFIYEMCDETNSILQTGTPKGGNSVVDFDRVKAPVVDARPMDFGWGHHYARSSAS